MIASSGSEAGRHRSYDRAMNGPLTVDRRGTITHFALDDGKANALSPSLIAELTAAIAEAEENPATTAIVLSGRTGVFSGGFDLDVMLSGDREATISLVADGGDLVRLIYAASVPVVAACTGHAIAAGALVLLGCDVRIGTEGTFKVGLNEVALGMVLPDWAVTIASTRLHRPHYERAVFNARLTDPAGAVDVGFLDALASPESVLQAAFAEAEALGALDRPAYRSSVERFRGPVLDRMATQIAADRALVS